MNEVVDPVSADEVPCTAPGMAGRELRLALAMRGGVSLAVWIGGGCAEIEALRLSCQGEAAGDPDGARSPGSDFWAPLLAAAGYGHVRVDVLAGASAGGLNGALLASSLIHGVPFDQYRDIWLEVADLKSLLRSTSEHSPVSVLRGDEYFLRQMEERLRGLVARAPAHRRFREQWLDLHLTATLLDPVALPVLDDAAEQHEEVSHRATFRFRHNPYTSDFRHDGDRDVVDAGVVRKLALAARATSSFPAAFEPAEVHVPRPGQLGRRARPEDAEDMFGLFSDASRTSHFVIDGGVLDNIPVGQALRAVREAPATGPTERWLLYLHPSPKAHEPRERDGARPHTVGTALGAFAARGTAESVLDDLALLREHNAFAQRYQTMRRALLGPLAEEGAEAFLSAADARSGGYRRLRAESEARRVRALLEDPAAALGEDPFTCADERWPLAGGEVTSMAARERLEEALRETLILASDSVPAPEGEPENGAAALRAARHGIEPLARTVQVCLDAAVRLERLGATGQASATLKERLYELSAAADLLDHIGELFWPVYAARHQPGGDLREWCQEAVAVRDRMIDDPQAAAADAPDLFEPFAALREELATRLGALQTGDDGGEEGALTARLWAELDDSVVLLAKIAREADPPTRDDETALYVRLLDHVHRDAADDRPGEDPPAPSHQRAARTLAALEVVTLPLRELSARPPQQIRYLRVAGSRPTPLERYFPGGRLDVGDKLAGNALANFSAFYKRSWRANDWMWGRLDTAATMVDLVLRPSTVAAHFSAPGTPPGSAPAARAAAFAKMVEDAVRAPLSEAFAGGDQAAWSAFFDELWRESSQAVRAEALALFGGDDASDLACARRLLTCRRQWELLAQEVPAVVRAAAKEGLDDGYVPRWAAGAVSGHIRGPLREQRLLHGLVADDAAARVPVHTPERLQDFLGRYEVGRESIGDDVGRSRLTSLVADVGLVTWRAATMSLGRRGRWLKPLGVVLAVVRAFALATVRAPRPALLLLPVIAALGSYVAVEDRAWLGLNRVTGTVLALAAVATLLLWARPRLPRGLLTVGALALAGWAAATAEASLALGWGGWQRTFGAGELRIGIVVFAAVTLGLPWAWRAARAGAGRVQRRRQRPQPGERADPCASGAPPD